MAHKNHFQHAVLALLAIAGVIAVVAWISSRGTSRTSEMSRAEAEAGIASSGKLSRIESRLDRLEQTLIQQNRAISAPAPLVDESPAWIQARSERALAESEAAAQRLRTGLDRRFASSPRPGPAEMLASRQLTHSMGDEALLATASPPVAHDIRCRPGLCRMEFSFNDADSADDWMTFYSPLTGQHVTRTQYFVENGANGFTRVVAYGHRR